jgi:hypothetical protein
MRVNSNQEHLKKEEKLKHFSFIAGVVDTGD